ncbi:MAG: RimK/LysX family protein [Cyanobacteria bacterium J06650_10]
MSKQLMHSLPGKILSFLVFVLFTFLAIVGMQGAFAENELAVAQMVGWAENIRITGVESRLGAKFDTGATTTSLNAEILEKPSEDVESGGIVKFNFVDADGNKTLFERPLERWVKIVGDDKRPVVKMNLCLAGEWIEGEANLSDREELDYAILVGRNMLKKGQLAVSSADSFTLSDNVQQRCEPGANR